jgi:hypothetical protein
MALEGSLRDFGLADILQLIYFQKKSGVLTLSGKDRVRLMFSGGNIVAAESRKRVEESRIGKILLKKGIIKEEDLKSSLEEQKVSGARIGDILLKRGLVEKSAIEDTLMSQMTDTVVQLFSWKEGTYEFQSQPVTQSKDMPIVLDTEHILMDGLRIIDEWSLVEGKVTLDTVFRRTDVTIPDITDKEENILKFVDGENDVSIIIDLSGSEDFEASKILASLMDRGLVEPVHVHPAASEVIAERPVVREGSLAKLFSPAVAVLALVISLAVAISQGAGLQSSLAALWSTDSSSRPKAVRDLVELRFKAEVYKYKNGSYPADIDLISKRKDPWGRPYVYYVSDEGLVILSAGPDGKTGTADDVY